MNNFSRIQLMDVLFNSLNFILFSGNIWFVILIEVFTNFYMKVLFDVTLVGLFYLVFLWFFYCCLFIVLPKFCIRISKNGGVVGVAVRYAGHTECLDFPVPYRRGYGPL